MVKFKALLFLLAHNFSSGLCEAANSPDGWSPYNPYMRRFVVWAVAALGLAIIILRSVFNRRGAAGKSVQGLSAAAASDGKNLRLKPARVIDLHNNRSYEVPVQSGLTLGRVFDNTLVIRNLSVSRYHAKIVPEEEGYMLYDLGSKKGTFVNGALVRKKLLKNNDMIEIAREDFLFVCGKKT